MANVDWDDYDEVLAAVTLCGTDLENADDDLKEEEEVSPIDHCTKLPVLSSNKFHDMDMYC